MKIRFFFLMILFIFVNTIFAQELYKTSDFTLRGTRSYWLHHKNNAPDNSNKKAFLLALEREDIQSHEQSYIYLFLGRLALDKGNIDEAKEYFEKSINLYSTPYPAQILFYYYQNNNRNKAKQYLLEGLTWYEKRVTKLLANSYDLKKLCFQNTRSPVDGSKDGYNKYAAMTNSTLPNEQRWLTHLHYCLENLNKLKNIGIEKGYFSDYDRTFYNTTDELSGEYLWTKQANTALDETNRYIWFKLFKKISWSGDASMNLTLYKNSKFFPFKLLYNITQKNSEGKTVDLELNIRGNITKNGECLFQGYDGEYYQFSLMEINDNTITTTFPYKTLYPVLGLPYTDDEYYLTKIKIELQ